MRKTVGVLAHVDSGKTTFSERVLYQAKAIRHLGRVDHQDAFLDAHPLEKQRGITIFSGLARFSSGGDDILWLDTPGHADFSPEMERALSVLDYAILLVSAAEGVQSHTETLWQLLADYGVPTFVFLNKTDRAGADEAGCLRALEKLSPDVIDLRSWQAGAMDEALIEALAGRDDALISAYLDGKCDEQTCARALTQWIKARRVFPVFSGSALTGAGVEAFWTRFCQTTATDYDEKTEAPFSARVYQIRRVQGARVVFLKILTGTLRVKSELPVPGAKVKVNEIRLYHGEKYQVTDAAKAGELAGAPGLEGLRAGDLIRADAPPQARAAHLQPMTEADVRWDETQTPATALMRALRTLEEEEPTLCAEDRQGAISLRVMGRIQLEVVARLLLDRFGIAVTFGPSRVLYRETIAAPCVGVGHYEPLRHYAEVHVRLVPGAPGSGVAFRSLCCVDVLPLHWQRLIETHVLEKTHKGVLCGEPLTGVVVELLSGRAHIKHTEGGDFRQATYRAIRNALMYAKSVLLEPVCRFRLRLPLEAFGKVTGELARMGARTDAPTHLGESVVLTGSAVYADFMAYQEPFLSVTHGKGGFDCRMDHYAPCHNAEEIISERAYNPLADDTPDSVFCARGAGYTVPWDQVRASAHLPVESEEEP